MSIRLALAQLYLRAFRPIARVNMRVAIYVTRGRGKRAS